MGIILAWGHGEYMKTWFEKTILIVDDDESDRYFLERSLRKAHGDLRIQSVEDGEEAIHYLNGDRKFSDREKYPFPIFIFIDLKMPRLNGFDVLQHLKKNPQWAIIPTLVYSGSSDEDDVKKAFLLGACAYHVKPRSSGERDELCKVLLDYWGRTSIPVTDVEGKLKKTNSAGKLGESIKPPGEA